MARANRVIERNRVQIIVCLVVDARALIETMVMNMDG